MGFSRDKTGQATKLTDSNTPAVQQLLSKIISMVTRL